MNIIIIIIMVVKSEREERGDVVECYGGNKPFRQRTA